MRRQPMRAGLRATGPGLQRWGVQRRRSLRRVRARQALRERQVPRRRVLGADVPRWVGERRRNRRRLWRNVHACFFFDCAAGQLCGSALDCQSASCSGGICQPSCFDLALNGDETVVDCGGACAPCGAGAPARPERVAASQRIVSGAPAWRGFASPAAATRSTMASRATSTAAPPVLRWHSQRRRIRSRLRRAV
jgi:hypothetical protein